MTPPPGHTTLNIYAMSEFLNVSYAYFLLMRAICSGDVDGMSAPGASPPVVKSLENAFTNAASAVLPEPKGTPPPAESLPPQTAPVVRRKS